MRAFICVDDGNGRLFCGRRQSRDRILTEDMLKTVGDGTLFLEKYSETLFETKEGKISVCSEPPVSADEYFFFEKTDPSEYEKHVSEWIVYRWNRLYPSDEKFGVDLSDGFRLVSSEDFVGSSHERITKEVYLRE